MLARALNVTGKLGRNQGDSVRLKRFNTIGKYAAVASALLVAACGGGAKQGEIDYVDGFYGGAVADDPKAVLVARDVLSAGGSAVDAAVAAYFTLSVVRPSAAGLAGGGACVVRSADGERVQALDFLPNTSAGGNVAVPSNLRGFFALHAKYGRLHWAELISPAEKIARFGSNVSRALALEIARLPASRAKEFSDQRNFLAPQGTLLAEGQRMTRPDLAGTLSQIRGKGVGDFYNGGLANITVAAFSDVGGTLKKTDLRAVSPKWRKPISVALGFNTAYFAPAPVTGSAVAAGVLARLIDDDRYEDAKAAQRIPLVAETYTYNLKQLRVNLAESGAANGAATGFSVVDGDGGAVACVVTMNRPFGTGRVTPGIGMLMAAPTLSNGQMLEVTPMVMGKTNVPEFVMAATATNGAASGALLAMAVAETVIVETPLQATLAAPRALWDAKAGKFWVEKGAQDAELRGLGYPVDQGNALGRLNALHCADGLPPHPELCTGGADPRAYGYAIMAAR